MASTPAGWSEYLIGISYRDPGQLVDVLQKIIPNGKFKLSTQNDRYVISTETQLSDEEKRQIAEASRVKLGGRPPRRGMLRMKNTRPRSASPQTTPADPVTPTLTLKQERNPNNVIQASPKPKFSLAKWGVLAAVTFMNSPKGKKNANKKPDAETVETAS